MTMTLAISLYFATCDVELEGPVLAREALLCGFWAGILYLLVQCVVVP